jgi:hypothetical protein
MLVAMLGFASFVAVEAATRPSRSVLWAAAGGLLAAGAMLAHLNGSIFVGIGFLVLLARRRFPESVAFAAAAVIALVPYAVDVARHRELFESQFHGSMVSGLTRFSLATPFLNLLKEHQRLFRMPQIIFPSALFFLSLLLGWRYASPRIRFMSGYTLLLMVALGAITSRKQVHYATYLAGFEVLVIVGILSHLPELDRRRRVVLLAFAAAFVVTGVCYDALDLKGKTRFEALHQVVARQIPDGAWCLTPMPLLFNEVTRLNLIATVSLKRSVSAASKPEEVRAFLAARQVEYVISMDGEPADSLLGAMGPLTLVAEGTMEQHPYRVFRVARPF